MEVYFSRHDCRQMRWREISEDEVSLTIHHPDKTEDSTNSRKNAFKYIGKRLLKVTYKEEACRIVIVTAIDKNN